MNIPIKSRNEILIPPVGYVFPFIDKEDMQLKAKLSDGLVINYTNVDDQLKVISLADFTSFEVMPNKKEIIAGSVDNFTGINYSIKVPACTIHKMTLRSSQEPENCDVVVDWGDGTVESIKDGKFVSHTKNKSYELEHDYSLNMTDDFQKFIVKIYGKNYYTFRNNTYKDNNLISRIFDIDLSIASHLTNFASMCYGATRLLKVKFPHSTKYVTDSFNFASTFEFCSNLTSVLGFEDNPLRNDCVVSNIFNGCESLEETDFVIPTCITSIAGILNNCKKLKSKIEKIIPSNGFALDNINTSAAFYNTPNLTGTIPSDLLWNSGKKFKVQSTFGNSGVSSQAPKSWGGTSSNEIINKTVREKLTEIEERLNNLSQQELLRL